MDSIEANKLGRPVIPNRQGLYAKAAKHATAALEVLVQLLESKNENIRLGAARTLLDKCLPDVKTVELSSNEDSQIHYSIIMGNGFIPPNLQGTATTS